MILIKMLYHICKEDYTMSDIDNNNYDQNQDSTNDISYNRDDQINQTESDSTYWESNEIQNSFNVQEQETEVNNSEYHQDVQDITYDEFKKKQYELQQGKKSKKKPILAVILTLALLLTTAATAYAFSDTVRNSIDMIIKSPKNYYAHIENKSLESSVDKSIAIMNMGKDNKNVAKSITTKLTYDKDTVGAMLQNIIGMSISDAEALIGIPLDSIGFDIVSANNDKENYQKINVNLNDIELIKGEVFTDNVKKESLFLLPQLSPAYLKQSLNFSNSGMDDYDFIIPSGITERLSSEDTGAFIKRYAKIITGEIDDVELTKDESLTVGDLSVEANLLTVTIYPETLMNIYIEILEEAKKDEYILDLLPLFDVTKEEYLTVIDESLVKAMDSMDYMKEEDEFIKMYVYVGNDGSILGRKIELIGDSGESFKLNFFHLEQNNKGAYELYISKEHEDSFIHVRGSHSKENEAYTGSGTLNMTSSDIEAVEVNFEYEGIKSEIKNNRVFMYGNISFSSYDMMGMEIKLEFDAKDEEQILSINLNMGRSSLVTLETSTKYLKDFTPPKPDSNADSYDMQTEMDAYASTIDIVGYISYLSDKLGLDLQTLLGSASSLF